MLFTSLVFGLFLPIVFATYWLIYYPKQGCEISSVRLWIQNLLLVVASYVFYGWWNWKFLLLIFFTSAWAYASGVLLDRTECTSRRKLIVALALSVNLGKNSRASVSRWSRKQGFALSPVIAEDAVFAFCIQSEVIDLFEVNRILYEHGLKIIPPK